MGCGSAGMGYFCTLHRFHQICNGDNPLCTSLVLKDAPCVLWKTRRGEVLGENSLIDARHPCLHTKTGLWVELYVNRVAGNRVQHSFPSRENYSHTIKHDAKNHFLEHKSADGRCSIRDIALKSASQQSYTSTGTLPISLISKEP